MGTMHDCAKDVKAHHDEAVTLRDKDRSAMRKKRDANRKRLKDGLAGDSKPAPIEMKSQGSYEMRTMVQHEENDYDIDDGAYFRKEDLVGEREAEMTSLQARKMVRDAIDDGCFKTPPEVRKNCVRVHYEAGYHVDVPVYRKVVTKDIFGREAAHYELAGPSWVRSDARDVTGWFLDENDRQSADGNQLRRVTRQLKAFARSRDSWGGNILSGFGITALVVECFRGDAVRDDLALHDTMRAIRDRLNWRLEIDHPVTPGGKITKDANDAKARYFRERLTEALNNLQPLHEAACTRERALGCWDKVFNTTFYSDRKDRGRAAAAVLTSGLLRDIGAVSGAAVRKEGGGRYA